MSDASEVATTVGWALWGMRLDDARYGLIDHSVGTVAARTFTDVISRYSPGTLDAGELPQVSIGWFDYGDKDRDYAVMTIHWAGGRSASEFRRDSMMTSCFCVPFDDIEAGSVTYRAMYERLSQYQLPLDSREPLRVGFPTRRQANPQQQTQSDDVTVRLAMRVAALLLTSAPVCVLGAHQLDCVERLRFIDTVASFLPYGATRRLSAATLVSGLTENHKARLFFADTARRATDRIVTWGELDKAKIDNTQANEYLEMLISGALTTAQLAKRRDLTEFSGAEVMRALTRPTLNSAAHGRHGRRRIMPAEAFGADLLTEPVQPPRLVSERDRTPMFPRSDRRTPPAPSELDELRKLLSDCAQELARGDDAQLSRVTEELRTHTSTHPSSLARQLRKLIVEHRLLVANDKVDVAELRPFFAELLRLAYGTALDYLRYCEVERDAGYGAGQQLHTPLALAMLDVGLQGPARLLVTNSLTGPERALAKVTCPVSPAESVSMMAEQGLEPNHTAIVWKLAIANLQAARTDDPGARAQFGAELDEYRLIPALQARTSVDADAKLNELTEILRYAYDSKMDLPSVRRVFSDLRTVPGAPLLAATLRLVKPTDQMTVTREFVFRYFASAGFSRDTLRELRGLVPNTAEPLASTARIQDVRPEPVPRRSTLSRGAASVLGWALIVLFVISIIGLVNFFVHVL